MPMNLNRKISVYRKTAILLSVILMLENLLPATLFALSGGPAQPEFAKFEAASVTGMINPFTGDFTYNLPLLTIPGANGGGYPVSLAYQSGVSPEEDASWTGYGWTLNPGAIVRNKRGFADDCDGQYVKYWNRVPANRTVSLGGSAGGEIFSFDLPVSGNTSLSYNTQRGFGYQVGVGLEGPYAGVMSLGFGVSNGEGRFNASVNPGKFLSKTVNARPFDESDDPVNYAATRIITNQYASGLRMNLTGGDYGIFSYAGISRPTAVTAYTGTSVTGELSFLSASTPAEAGPTFGLEGTYSVQENVGVNGVIGAADSLKSFGYLYSGYAGPDDMMDYTVEKGGSYDKQDRMLGIPFSAADNFSVSGQGIGGGFRAYQKTPGHFHPNHKKSTTTLINTGVEGEAGFNVGAGLDGGGGQQTLEMTSWSNPGNTVNYRFDKDTSATDESFFFRFNNDKGGEVSYAANDNLIQGKLNPLNTGVGSKAFEVNIPSAVYNDVNNGVRSSRSSYIAYHTNAEMAVNDMANGKKFKAYTRDVQANRFVKRSGGNANPVNKGIGEFAIFNESGSRYVYGLPVYARNEINMQYDLKNASVQQNYLAYKNISNYNDLKTIVGEERPAPYAESFLLTEITSSDYIDKTGNGATSDDIGAYTKFNYKQVFGTDSSQYKNAGNNWFKWRAPFTGLMYERNSMSDPSDDVGTVSAGEKEVYYLESIETKTHIAYFITDATDFTVNGILIKGSGVQRKDAIEAADNVTAAANPDARGSRRLQKLERVELYAKNSNGLPAKKILTVNLAYDYSLCPGIPNQADYNPASPGAPNTGKLTLRKVWFDYADIQNALISPYEFDYNYPAAGIYPARYQQALGNYGSGMNQNPAYSVFQADGWGDYQYGGQSRFNRFRDWNNQGADDPQFDPAAWHLKQIRLPSKGQIHIQYEQKTYSYVQDRRALGMCSLSQVQSTDKFYLNTDEIGVVTAAEKSRLIDLIRQEYIEKGQRIYFRFFYTLLGNNANTASSGNCNGEFITGYANVTEVNVDQQGLYVKLQGGQELPVEVCRDFVSTQRAGKLVLNGNCDASDGVDMYGEPLDVITSFAAFLSQFGNSIPGAGGNTCMTMSMSDSYLRVPLVNPKKGGGVRVKRLLLFDSGMESGDAGLFGKEFLYETTEPSTGRIISSGVAVNEPMTFREENALVTCMDRFKQTLLNKVVAGRDKETSEGPAGESVLPSPSIGYSRVVTKDIYNGKTNPGFTVDEYYTARDFPFDRTYAHLTDGSKTGFDFTPIEEERDWIAIPAGVSNYNLNNLWLTQGYRFILNEMHGQPRSSASYGGQYHLPDTWILGAKSEYDYFEPGEPVPVQEDIFHAPVLKKPGREMEVVFEERAIEDILSSASLEADVDVGLTVVPAPFFSAFPSVIHSESRLRTHVSSTVIHYPAFLKSVKTYTDGIYSQSFHTAFSPFGGAAITTSTTDEYHGLDLQQSTAHNGTIRSTSIPAGNEIPEMRYKSANERLVVKAQGNDVLSKTIASSHVYVAPNTGASAATKNLMKRLAPGDLVALYDQSTNSLDGIYHVDDFYNDQKPFELLPTRIYKYNHTSPLSSVRMEVLRSGFTNQPDVPLGSISTYGSASPADSVTRSMNNVLSANAVLMKNDWPYDTLSFGGFPNNLPSGISNKYETGETGRWRMHSSYSYNTSVVPGNNEAFTSGDNQGTSGRSYNEAGVFNDFVLFHWGNTTLNNTNKWIASERITGYTPSGEATGTRNAMNTHKTAKLGYQLVLPTLTAANAAYHAVQFESFENNYLRYGVQYLEDGLILPNLSAIDASLAHAGRRSMKLNTAVPSLAMKRTLPDTSGVSFSFRLWMKENNATNGAPVSVGATHPYLRISFDSPSGLSAIYMTKVAQTGEWSLYEAVMTQVSPLTGFIPTVNYSGAPAANQIWIDDVRIQPKDAQATMYVYDTQTLRLLTRFDDQHFGVYYQYDAEGRLKRQIIETEKGRRTIQEMQMNIPTVNRN